MVPNHPLYTALPDGVQRRLNSEAADLVAHVGKGGKKISNRVAILCGLPLLPGSASKAVSEMRMSILSPRRLGTLSLRLCF